MHNLVTALIVGYVAGLLTAVLLSKIERPPKQPWTGWASCPHCRGRFPRMMSDNPYCSDECSELASRESLE